MIRPTNHKIGPTPGAGRGEQPAGAGRHSFQTRPKTDGFLTESAVRLPAPHLRMAIRDGLAGHRRAAITSAGEFDGTSPRMWSISWETTSKRRTNGSTSLAPSRRPSGWRSDRTRPR